MRKTTWVSCNSWAKIPMDFSWAPNIFFEEGLSTKRTKANSSDIKISVILQMWNSIVDYIIVHCMGQTIFETLWYPGYPISVEAFKYWNLLKGTDTRTVNSCKAHHIYKCSLKEQKSLVYRKGRLREGLRGAFEKEIWCMLYKQELRLALWIAVWGNWF